PEELVRCIDFTYITDVITPQQATEILKSKESGKAARMEYLQTHGYPAYTTSAGWLGYSDEKMRRLWRESRVEGFKHMKIKVGSNLQDEIRRADSSREEIVDDLKLMMDATQKLDVDQAIENMESLKQFNPWW